MKAPTLAPEDQLPPQEEVGAELLDTVLAVVSDYVIFPNAESAVAFVLWIAATHAQPSWEHATRFVVKSPIKRCGKTRLQEIGRELAHRALSTVNISPAALVHSIDEDDPPTIFLDEADTVFAKKGKEAREGAEDIRGILNSGHSRGWPYIRWNVQRREREECATFAMALIGGIGDMPDTIEDRAVVVALRRRAPGERVQPFRRKRTIPTLHVLRQQISAWVNRLDLADVEPDLPVEDRDADKWEPLVAIADAAGGDWPDRARMACRVLCGATSPDEGTVGERLLVDLYEVFGDADVLFTETILAKLTDIDEAPWSDWYGKQLNARGLARLLHPFGVKSVSVRLGAATAKGYRRADLLDAWARYTHPADTDDTTVTAPVRPTGSSDGTCDVSPNPKGHTSVTTPATAPADRDAVTDVTETNAGPDQYDEIAALWAEAQDPRRFTR